MTEETKTDKIKFICYGVGAWGAAATYDKAMANYKEASGNKQCCVYMWADDEDLPSKAWGHMMGITWEDSKQRPILIQDHRLAKWEKKSPLQIGAVLY